MTTQLILCWSPRRYVTNHICISAFLLVPVPDVTLLNLCWTPRQYVANHIRILAFLTTIGPVAHIFVDR
jgi:hypothetical protein